ncbi:phytoene desaturase family protein [Arcobacter sp.]|uniref:phytoene desaturase family protein n=1 Tax=Arcobacter sp. TaxID=1872629 RepID=UPI003D1368C4
MQEYDLAIIGSGIGGALIAALNKNKNHILFEKDSNLGGCASTFKRYGNYYNVGATTFVGYEENHIIKKIFDDINYVPNIEESKIAIRTIQDKKVVDRVRNFEEFLIQIQEYYPNKNNRIFWGKIKKIDERFWQIKNIHFAKYSLKSYLKSLLTFKDLIKTFEMDLFKSASSFIKDTLGDISKEYQNFIDAQLLITVQSKLNDVSLLSMALGLSYPFHKVFYVNNGMGTIIEDILKEVNVHKKEEILNIKSLEDGYLIRSSKDEYKAKNIVLNTTIYDSKNLFDEKIKSYYEKFEFSDQSAFTLYLKIDSKKEFLEHYQIILKDDIPNCISNSFFISFSKLNDEKMSQNGYSVTISTHTKVTTWKALLNEEYKKQKEITQNFILEHFLDYFDTIKQEQIIKIFSATSLTFQRFIGRENCGGKAINLKTILQTPTCKTPFKGLYNVGDTIFAGQGWPGVALGASILDKELNEEF